MKIPRKFRKHIEIVPGRCSGKPTIKGTRLKTEFIKELTSAGWHEKVIADEYIVTIEEVKACLAFEQYLLDKRVKKMLFGEKEKKTLFQKIKSFWPLIVILIAWAIFMAGTLNLMNYYASSNRRTPEEIQAEDAYIQALKDYIQALKEEIRTIEEDMEKLDEPKE